MTIYATHRVTVQMDGGHLVIFNVEDSDKAKKAIDVMMDGETGFTEHTGNIETIYINKAKILSVQVRKVGP